MRALVLAALALGLHACAAHNSHRVPLDLNAELAPLIDEAWAHMETNWNEPVPVGGVPVVVDVDEVEVQWLPYSAEVPPGGSVLSQAELRQYVVDALRLQTPPSDAYAGRAVRVELATDLHQPDGIALRVVCRLLEAGEEREQLARGTSSCLRFERLYCHGCRDRWTGLGTELDEPHASSPDGEFEGGVLGVILFPRCDPAPGYHKN